MTFCLSKRLLTYSFRKLSKRNVLLSKYLSEVCKAEKLVDEGRESLSNVQNEENKPQEERRILKAAIIGTPNVGKSTLINQLVGRRVFAISKKVHTTKCQARAVYVIGNTQLVILDTPGLVNNTETTRHKLERSFMVDGEKAIANADIVGVMHDVSNTYTRDRLDPKVLRLLHLYEKKNIFLILNKIDCIKKKRTLLDLVDKLTCKQLSSTVHESNMRRSEEISENEILKRIKNKCGWPGFQEVFMISAIEGFGIGDIMEYLLKMARPGSWLFPEDVYTDKVPRSIIEEAVRSKLLDYVPHEIPYNVQIELELFDKNKEGDITAFVVVTCQSPRVEKLIRGGKNGKIRIIENETTEDLKNTFQQNVNLRINVTTKGAESMKTGK